MNEITENLSWIIWAFAIFIFVFSIFFAFWLWFFGSWSINLRNKKMDDCFSKELINFDIKNTSRTLKKKRVKIYFFLTNIIYISCLFSIAVLSLLKISGVDENGEGVQWNLLWINYIVLLLAVLFAEAFLLVAGFFFLKKKEAYELSDQELVKSFLNFKDDWIKQNGNQMIDVKKLMSYSTYNFALNVIDIKRSLNAIRRSKNYEIWAIEGFKTYLFNYYKYYLNPGKNTANKEMVKFAIIHNFMCELDISVNSIAKK